MPSEQQALPLGYRAARNVIEIGYEAMFEGCKGLIPDASDLASEDDNRTPQFGFVGPRYAEMRVLVLGVNPGVVKRGTVKERDQRSLEALRRFRDEPTPSNFSAAKAANRIALESWREESRHWKHLLQETSLTFDDIAFSNCLPWRTNGNKFPAQIQVNAAYHYVWPLVEELNPRLVICFGRNAASAFEPKRRRVPLPKGLSAPDPGSLPTQVCWPRDRAPKFGRGSKFEKVVRDIRGHLSMARAA